MENASLYGRTSLVGQTAAKRFPQDVVDCTDRFRVPLQFLLRAYKRGQSRNIHNIARLQPILVQHSFRSGPVMCGKQRAYRDFQAEYYMFRLIEHLLETGRRRRGLSRIDSSGCRYLLGMVQPPPALFLA